MWAAKVPGPGTVCGQLIKRSNSCYSVDISKQLTSVPRTTKVKTSGVEYEPGILIIEVEGLFSSPQTLISLEYSFRDVFGSVRRQSTDDPKCTTGISAVTEVIDEPVDWHRIPLKGV